MKKTFQEFEELGTNKVDLKLKFKRDYDLEERIDKLIEKIINIFPKSYNDHVYLDGINF